MTGFTAISDVLPHIDRGTRKGRPYPIAVKSWFTSSGTIIPLSFKFEGDDGEIHYIQNIHVKSSEEKHYAGIPSRDFSCTAVLGGLEQSFRLVYYPAEIKTTSLAGGLSTAYKAAVTSLALKGPLIKI